MDQCESETSCEAINYLHFYFLFNPIEPNEYVYKQDIK